MAYASHLYHQPQDLTDVYLTIAAVTGGGFGGLSLIESLKLPMNLQNLP